MGLGDTIEDVAPESYRQYFIKYAQLRDLVLELAEGEAQHGNAPLKSVDLMDVSATPLGKFQDMLRLELQKVNAFAMVKHEALFLGLRRLCDDCAKLAHKLKGGGANREGEIQKMSQAIEAMGEEIVHLDTYVRLNYAGFQKITQKFDRCLGITGSALFVAGLHTEPFCNVRFDDILVLLGLAWDRWRVAQEQSEQNKGAKWEPPASFIRNTAKFWVRPDKVVLLKTRIVRHLPYLIFGLDITEQEKLLDPFALLSLDQSFDVQSAMGAYAGTVEESQLLSSVYFDSPDAISYRERIRREEGARLVRFRWYGENNLEPDKDIFIERKIHHEGFSGAKSVKERGILPQKDILEYMNGKFDIEKYFADMAKEGRKDEKTRREMHDICVEVDDMIKNKQLQPIIRTSYYRSAFQSSTNNQVRISLDTQMSLINEFREGGHTQEPWCHTSSDKLAKNEVYRFPFAILEIKLQNVSENPLWLKQTLADIGAIQVHKFSKFQHAMAFLHPDKVPILPHWHQDFKEWHEKKERAFQFTAKRTLTVSRMVSNVELEVDVPDIRAVPAPRKKGTARLIRDGEEDEEYGHQLKDMKHLDPKGVFANERTLLHYAEKGLYVGALAIVLINQSGTASKVAGGVLSVSTGIFYVWALYEYYSRLGAITGRSKVGKTLDLRLDWVHGPLIVGALIMLVLFISLVEAWQKSV